ncbi:MAG: hypothetical protein MUE36_00860 [Acidimicrobiales bacterium]|nr:hypothetical protein [Acidimicrobiales bacterium]
MTIAGNPPEPSVSVEDDGFHPPTSDDPTWIETVWFPFWVPELDASVHTRVWLRPNQGLQGGAVTSWRGENRYLAHDSWTGELVSPPDLCDLRMADRFHLEVVEPLHTYRVRHAGEHIEVDITFTGLMAPNPVAPDESPGMFDGHLEQPGRVQGRVRLADRWFDVDCASVRDRSWGPRTMRPGLRLGNAHGTSVDGSAFFVYVDPGHAGHDRITSGYWRHDGRAARLVDGVRRTELDGDFPATVEIDAHDALGRRLVTRGDCRNLRAVDAGDELYAVLNLIRWELPGGTTAWGENHDIWARSDWIAAGRAPLTSR